MIDIKYKKIYDEFINNYEEIHLDPWHEISKEELDNIYNKLVNDMDINDEYSFCYFIKHIIKRLNGSEDAHTKYSPFFDPIPYTFRKIDNEVFLSYPNDLYGYSLTSINGVSIDKVMDEIDDIISYGTEGKRDYEIELTLFSKLKMFSLPSFRESDDLTYQFEKDGKVINKKITRDEKYKEMFNEFKYLYGKVCGYEIVDNCLIYTHRSVQNQFEERIKQTIENLEKEDIDNVDTIIVDIRGNTGGNAKLNWLLMDYLKDHLAGRKLLCLTDYKVFSGGRYALGNLLELGATTIGDEIGTPINCFGNSNWIEIDGHRFSVSECYFYPFKDESYDKEERFKHVGVGTKEEFKDTITDELRIPYIYKPDVLVKQTKEDFLNKKDTVLEFALSYSKGEKVKKKSGV